MVKHLLFLRWWVIVCLTSVAMIFSYQLGAITEIVKNDWTYISPVIFVCFAFMSAWCGLKTFLLSKNVRLENKEKIAEIEIQEEIGWFAADAFQVLGFIGTICGMIYALKGFVGVDLGDVTAVQGLVSNLVSGVSVAFYTTLAGLIASLLLKVQYFNLSYARQQSCLKDATSVIERPIEPVIEEIKQDSLQDFLNKTLPWRKVSK